MNQPIRSLVLVCGAIAVSTLTAACSHMSACERNTAVGAALGGVAGSALSNGSTVGTVGGAVAGGVIGNRSTEQGC